MGDIAVFRSYNWPDKAADIWRWSNEAIKTREPVLPKILLWFSGETLCIIYFISYAVFHILCVIFLKEEKNDAPTFLNLASTQNLLGLMWAYSTLIPCVDQKSQIVAASTLP